MANVQTEQVLVVPTAVFHQIGHFQGFCGDAQRYLNELLLPQHTSFRPRSEVEQDPSFKQLIPYVLFQHIDEAGCRRIFQYTRGTGQGEGRLHRKRSVGIGGHISLDDVNETGVHAYQEGLRRELTEEVHIDSPYTDRCVGLINDDETEVGKVHLGVVHLFTLQEPAVRPREAELLSCGFESVDDLLADLAGFETWSSITLAALFKSERVEE